MSEQTNTGFPSTLITSTPEEGFALAVKFSRLGVKAAQPDMEVLKKLRPEYANNADSLIAASQVVAIHFQTVAAANNYWSRQ
ncbi:MAG: hexameric tyrosine-coordinated heme protein [Gammaproteobacteria bacterium]|nr:hexameric tyrosine-coordinated heme protein [Gammaproteobacteria bacterium]